MVNIFSPQAGGINLPSTGNFFSVQDGTNNFTSPFFIYTACITLAAVVSWFEQRGDIQYNRKGWGGERTTCWVAGLHHGKLVCAGLTVAHSSQWDRCILLQTDNSVNGNNGSKLFSNLRKNTNINNNFDKKIDFTSGLGCTSGATNLIWSKLDLILCAFCYVVRTIMGGYLSRN